MINPLFLKTVIKDYKIFPNKDGKVVEMIANDNSTYEAIVGKAEVELALFIKCNLSNLEDIKKRKLIKLIENFASEKYEEGQDDIIMQ